MPLINITNCADLENYRLSYTDAKSHLKDYVYARSREAFALGDRERNTLATPDAVRERQEQLRQFVIDSVGGLPPSDTPLQAETLGCVKGEGFTIEKVVFQSRPGHYVTNLLYLPDERPERCAAVLFLCGHSYEGKHYDGYQSVCQTLAQAGLIVLAQDPVGQGDRHSYYDRDLDRYWVEPAVREHDYAGIQCRIVGDNIARYFIHDSMRAIDYLQSRPEVDPDRIGVTGNSGGGTQTSLVMLTEPRLKAAAPGTFIMDRDTYQRAGQAQDAEQIWPGFTAAGYDHEDILLAMAPKPVCVLAVKSDFFCIEGTRRTVERSRRVWDLFGAGASCALELVEDDSIHCYTQPLARAAACFFTKHLMGKTVDPANLHAKPFAKETVYVTPQGLVSEAYPDAAFAFEANLARFHQAREALARLDEPTRRQRAIHWLKAQIFADRQPCPLNPRFYNNEMAIDGLNVEMAYWWTQPFLANHGMLFTRHSETGVQPALNAWGQTGNPGIRAKRPVTIALWARGTGDLSQHFDWIIQENRRGRSVLVLNLSGVGPMEPHPVTTNGPMHEFYGTLHKLSDDLTWLGDSLAALRAYEVTRALEVIAHWPGLDAEDIRYHGVGRPGAYAVLAAAVDERLRGGDWERPFRFADIVENRFYNKHDIKSLVLPGILQYTDLDELAH